MSIVETGFIKATRTKLRFQTSRGNVTVEDLWDLPLTQGADSLNNLAKAIKRKLKETDDEGLVKTSNRGTTELQLKLDLLTYVFNERTEEAQAATDAEKRRQDRARIQELISRKQDQELEGKSVEELQALLDNGQV